jgi:phosphonate transport system substrate-binding protein
MPATAGLALLLAPLAGVCGVAEAAWRDDVATVRIGFMAPRGAAYDAASLEPFRAYMERRLAHPVELVPAATYGALIDSQVSGRVPYAIHSAVSFATAAVACRCVQAVAVPTSVDGARGFHAILLVPADSPIGSLAEAAGARLAVAGEDSLAGRLVPMAGLARAGIAPSEHFAGIVEFDGPAAAVAALFSGAADVAVGWSAAGGDPAGFSSLSGVAIDGLPAAARVRTIWTSRLIPFGPHVLRDDVDGELKTLIVDALMAMAVEDEDALAAVNRTGIASGALAAPETGDYALIDELIAGPDAGSGG